MKRPQPEPSFFVGFFLPGLSLTFYAVVSIATVFVNRRVLSHDYDHPLVIAWFQQFITLCIFHLLFRFEETLPPTSIVSRFNLRRIAVSWETCWRLCPLSCCYIAMLSANNYCLKYVPVSTYQVARALTLPCNVMLSKLMLGLVTNIHSLCACLITSLGFCVGGLDRTTLSPAGCLTGALGSLTQALYTVGIRFGLQYADKSRAKLLYYNALLSLLLFLPILAMTGELSALVRLVVLCWMEPRTVALITLSGVFGLLVNLASYCCLQVTTPLSYSITGYAKSAVQSLGTVGALPKVATTLALIFAGGILIIHEPYSAASITGMLLTLAGSAYYSVAQLL